MICADNYEIYFRASHSPDVADAVVVDHGVVRVDRDAARVAGAGVELGAVGPDHADRLLDLKLFTWSICMYD